MYVCTGSIACAANGWSWTRVIHQHFHAACDVRALAAVASNKQRNLMAAEFYGKEYVLFEGGTLNNIQGKADACAVGGMMRTSCQRAAGTVHSKCTAFHLS